MTRSSTPRRLWEFLATIRVSEEAETKFKNEEPAPFDPDSLRALFESIRLEPTAVIEAVDRPPATHDRRGPRRVFRGPRQRLAGKVCRRVDRRR